MSYPIILSGFKLNPLNKELSYISESFIDWFVGFTDGEGNFSIVISPKGYVRL